MSEQKSVQHYYDRLVYSYVRLCWGATFEDSILKETVLQNKEREAYLHSIGKSFLSSDHLPMDEAQYAFDMEYSSAIRAIMTNRGELSADQKLVRHYAERLERAFQAFSFGGSYQETLVAEFLSQNAELTAAKLQQANTPNESKDKLERVEAAMNYVKREFGERYGARIDALLKERGD